ncbi:MAG TPA: choice-of-anchor B family protein [Fimbriimonadaceae bacterium]|nr:choice-of-anchor B family protein [Fimbriimonadaceae bacterium]HRJ96408.1 choice-of-anchor B family protein [Fimbriimonadaceae bacterium]
MKAYSVLATLALVAGVSAQYTSSKVSLYSQINLTTFDASSGNGCWGYVSPSGREYAIMGLSNKAAFVEITNPASPVWVTSVAHSSSQWADIKTYGRYCYVVTEASGSGIQVIDMANIDQGSVTLVRTILPPVGPGRTHTIFVDTESGFLYTCGSRENSGWTTIWSLADPSNPQKVGPPSVSGGDYVHECQVKTYTTGPAAGRQIMYACGANRGLEIFDVTDKNNTFLIRRITYPGVAYCHQGWLSEDLRYFYVNDELDEQNLGSVQKTFVFDVSNPLDASYIGTFSRNESNIDHNLYYRNGFVFESNYTRGLRIFDASDDPEAPAFVGFFDTYPTSNSQTFNGAWSNYPYFPSGTVIVSDINRGLFILNPAAALARLTISGSITLSDYLPGPEDQTVDVEIRRTGQPTYTKTVTLGAGGAYSFTLNNTLANANCTFAFKSERFLRETLAPLNVGASGISNVNAALINGDIDGDNAIDIGDFAILSGTFGSSFVPADLDGDGEVAIGDYAILSQNFGLNGDN